MSVAQLVGTEYPLVRPVPLAVAVVNVAFGLTAYRQRPGSWPHRPPWDPTEKGLCLDGEHQEEPVPHTIRYSVGDNRIDITLDDGAKSSLWWGTKNEWLGLLDVAGLEREALYGGFAREPFADDSREYVFVARR